MGNVIVNTLDSIKDIGYVGLQVSGDDAVKAKVAPVDAVPLDFKERHLQPYTVTYTCRHLESSKVAPMAVAATRAAGILAQVRTRVTCKVPGDPVVHKPEKVLPPVAPFFAPLIPIVPIPPRPPDVGGNPNPQPNPQAQAQGQAQGAFAAQEQKQPQLAYAHDTKAKPDPAAAQEEGDRFAFSRFRQAPSRSPLDPLFVLSAAAMTCAAGAMLVRRRIQFRAARATRGTRRDRRSYGRGY
jgi:hypothetical protein